MANPISDFIAGIFRPVADVVEHVLPSGDAKLQLQGQMVTLQVGVAEKLMDYAQQLLDAQSKIITAEAQGGSWLQRNWRPITMMTFLILVVCDSFAILPNRLAAQAWTLLQFGLGGYVVGRSAEKIAVPAVQALLAAVKK